MKKIVAFIALVWCCSLVMSYADNQQLDIVTNMDVYNAVYRELSINYVDTINYKDLNETAITSMLQKLDPYTTYFSESEEDDLKRMTTGTYGGIGAIISQQGNSVVVAEPYEGMPAQKHDIRAGDIFLEIDGQSMKGKSSTEVSQLLRGPQGTEISLKLERPGEKKPIKKSFLREVIQINPVEYYCMLNDTTGYISLQDFTDKSYVEFRNALLDLVQNRGMQNLVIDLRNNGGGIVSQAVDIAGLFLPKQSLVVSMRGVQPQSVQSYRTSSEPIFPDMPLVFLVNSNSASASEILAGAFQDMDRAVILGERTYGKGLVQTVRRLPHNTYLKVTTAKYYIPSGRCVQAIDYAKRKDDGSIERIPDSLTHVFFTRNGRHVRDGGGILPDIELKRRTEVNISYYLYVKNVFFNYATDYVLMHKTIPPADQFQLTDDQYEAFIRYVLDSNFTYRLQSEKALQDLKEVIKIEGLGSAAQETLAALESILQPNIERDLRTFRKDVEEFLSSEIIRRYYYQHGVIASELRYDEWLKEAVKTIGDKSVCNAILSGK